MYNDIMNAVPRIGSLIGSYPIFILSPFHYHLFRGTPKFKTEASDPRPLKKLSAKKALQLTREKADRAERKLQTSII